MQHEYRITTPWYRGMFVSSAEFIKPLDWRYTLEKWMYGVSSIIGFFAFLYTVRKLVKTERKDLVLAARLFSYKISLTVADVIILFLYAPTQFIWISTFWWYGGDLTCRMFKFLSTFGFHLTANMQVLIAFDRLYITSTMSTRRLTNTRRDTYNTRRCLIGAWAMALLCSCPQLYIFGVAKTGEGHEQCVSLWLQKRMEYVDKREYLKLFDHYLEDRENKSSPVYFPNGTARYYIPDPSFTQESIMDASSRIVLMEQIYNVIHLATICVVPYALELFCYTFILCILKGAQNGYFMTISDVFKAKLCCFTNPVPKTTLYAENSEHSAPSLFPRCMSAISVVRPTRGHNSQILNASYETVKTDNDGSSLNIASGRQVEHLKLNERESQLFRDRSVSCSNVNEYSSSRKPFLKRQPHSLEEECPPRSHRSFSLFGRDIVYEARKSVPALTWGRLSLHLPRISILRPDPRFSVCEPSNMAPWLATVGSARKKARQKAFWMLSVNLLLWSPYCLVGIINAATIFPDFVNFQFVAALVAFNAISNIVL